MLAPGGELNSSVMAKTRSNSKRGADHLVQKSRLQQSWKGGKSSEDSSGIFQLGVHPVECREVVLIHQRGGEEGPRNLCDRVGQHLAPGKSSKHSERQSDGGVQVRA